jgi:hypothetical protein
MQCDFIQAYAELKVGLPRTPAVEDFRPRAAQEPHRAPGARPDGNGVLQLRALKGLTALQELDLSGTNVSSLEPLKGLTALQKLSLWGTKVSSLEPLKDLTALQKLNPARAAHRGADGRLSREQPGSTGGRRGVAMASCVSKNHGGAGWSLQKRKRNPAVVAMLLRCR